VFTIPELRRKIYLTLILLAVYRIGWQVPLPIFDQAQLKKFMDASAAGGLLKTVAQFSASSLQNGTIFGLGIMPYISASIILQLLGTFWKPIEALQKEGDSGRKKINQYTRLLTVVLCFIQSWIYVSQVGAATGSINPQFTYTADSGAVSLLFSWHLISVLIMTAGSVFLMWLGEQIDEYGIGNGISLLIMANILSNLPGAVIQAADQFTFELGGNGQDKYGIEVVILMIGFFILVVLGVVLMTLGQRRIPTLSAKHVRGNRVYGGTKEFLPLKVNQSGVMPIIFASSLLLFPAMIFSGLYELFPNAVMGTLKDVFSPQGHAGLIYNLILVAMIFFFCYFWTAISFNPKEIAENLKNMGSFIPGHRPGTPTAHYLEKVMVRITFVGAFFLSIVAILPTFVQANFPMASNAARVC
jgi:preprotein translocase subunit SecY